jgi:RarD protein
MNPAYLWIILSFLIWGSVGLFVRWAGLPSEVIVFYRVAVAFILLGAYLLFRRQKPSLSAWKTVLLSGVALALNWVFFFKAIQTTTIANAVLSYYLAPVFVTLFTPLLLSESVEKSTWLAMAVSFTGIFLMIDPSGTGFQGRDALGIFYGLIAALFYAMVTLLGKKTEGISPVMLVFWQTGISSLLLWPYAVGAGVLPPSSWAAVLALGAVHTALALVLYFSGLKKVRVQHVGVLAYLDPLSAILFSLAAFGEIPSSGAAVGGALILWSNWMIMRRQQQT